MKRMLYSTFIVFFVLSLRAQKKDIQLFNHSFEAGSISHYSYNGLKSGASFSYVLKNKWSFELGALHNFSIFSLNNEINPNAYLSVGKHIFLRQKKDTENPIYISKIQSDYMIGRITNQFYTHEINLISSHKIVVFKHLMFDIGFGCGLLISNASSTNFTEYNFQPSGHFKIQYVW